MVFPNGKRYVGISTRPLDRRRDHFRIARGGGRLPVYCAIRHFGEASVRWRVLLWGGLEFAKRMEVALISAWDTTAPGGYNVSHGGDIAPSKSASARQKIRESALRRWSDPAYREFITETSKAQRPTEEQRRNNGAAKLRNWQDPEYRRKCVESHQGKVQSSETVARRAEAIRQNWATSDRRERNRAAMSGRMWANNGVEHRQFRQGERIPSGWARGMLKRADGKK